MLENIDDFISDWNIDIKTKSAQHKTGLIIAYESQNEDGSIRLAYKGVMSWQKYIYSIAHDINEIEKKRKELASQFLEIYRNKMIANAYVKQNSTLER